MNYRDKIKVISRYSKVLKNYVYFIRSLLVDFRDKIDVNLS